MIYLLLMCAIMRDVYINIDDSPQSQILVKELERDWTKFNGPQTPSNKEMANKFARIQKTLKSQYRIHWDREYHYGVRAPAIRFSRDWQSYDPRAFKVTTFPLLTTVYLIECHYIDETNDRYEKYQLKLTEEYENNSNIVFEKAITQLKKENPQHKYWVPVILPTEIWHYTNNNWYKIKVPSEAFEAPFVYLNHRDDYKDRSDWYVNYNLLTKATSSEKGPTIDEVFDHCEDAIMLEHKITPIKLPSGPFPFVFREPTPPWEEPYKWAPE